MNGNFLGAIYFCYCQLFICYHISVHSSAQLNRSFSRFIVKPYIAIDNTNTFIIDLAVSLLLLMFVDTVDISFILKYTNNCTNQLPR